MSLYLVCVVLGLHACWAILYQLFRQLAKQEEVMKPRKGMVDHMPFTKESMGRTGSSPTWWMLLPGSWLGFTFSHPQGQLRGLYVTLSFGLCLIIPGFSTQAVISPSKYLLGGWKAEAWTCPHLQYLAHQCLLRQSVCLYKSERIIHQSLWGEDRVFDLSGCLTISTPPMEKDLKTRLTWPLSSILGRQ